MPDQPENPSAENPGVEAEQEPGQTINKHAAGVTHHYGSDLPPLTFSDLLRRRAATTEMETVVTGSDEAGATRVIQPHWTGMESLDATPAPPKKSPFPNLRDKDGVYEPGRMIGRGGQGEVWEAVQVDLGRVVALKTAKPKDEVQIDFLKEAYTAAQLDHPNIIPIYDIGVITSDGKPVPVLAMKRIHGRSWHDIMLEDRLSAAHNQAKFLARHIPILVQVVNAVGYAHSKHIIHRDLKPIQVMVGEFGEVFLLDWGLAILMDQENEMREVREYKAQMFYTLDTATNPAGTPIYMAPEQAISDSAGLGYHTDIYLIGAILFEILTGRPPHHAETVADAMERAVNNICPPYPEHAPPELVELARHCLATRKEDRPSSVIEVREALESHLTGASRKDESIRLTEKLEGISRLHDYEALSAAAKDLVHAQQLWPENPDLPSCQRTLLVQFVHTALAKKDFLLAQFQADRLIEPTLVEDLRRQIDAAREEAASRIPLPPLLTAPRIFIALATYALMVLAFLALERTSRLSIQREVSDKVMSLAKLAADSLRAEDLRKVDGLRDINSAEFQRVLSQLNSHRSANADVRFIYTFRPEPNSPATHWRVLVDADPVDVDVNGDGRIEEEEKGNPPGTIYTDGVPAMTEAMTARMPTSSMVKDSWGDFISGFAPVIDPKSGDPVAVVGVDILMRTVQPKVTRMQLSTAGVAVGLIVLATVTFWAFFSSRRAIERIHQLEEEINRQNQEIRGRTLYLG